MDFKYNILWDLDTVAGTAAPNAARWVPNIYQTHANVSEGKNFISFTDSVFFFCLFSKISWVKKAITKIKRMGAHNSDILWIKKSK